MLVNETHEEDADERRSLTLQPFRFLVSFLSCLRVFAVLALNQPLTMNPVSLRTLVSSLLLCFRACQHMLFQRVRSVSRAICRPGGDNWVRGTSKMSLCFPQLKFVDLSVTESMWGKAQAHFCLPPCLTGPFTPVAKRRAYAPFLPRSPIQACLSSCCMGDGKIVLHPSPVRSRHRLARLLTRCSRGSACC